MRAKILALVLVAAFAFPAQADPVSIQRSFDRVENEEGVEENQKFVLNFLLDIEAEKHTSKATKAPTRFCSILVFFWDDLY
jgi:hypothetical protein